MAGFDLNHLLNGKSKATGQIQSAAEAQDTSFNIVMIDVEDLMPSKDNFYSTENIEELALSIELAGCIEQNLVVKPKAHGKHEVIAGHRRRLAALKLVNEGKEEYRKVPCRIKTESDEIKDKLSLIFTNATTRQLSDWEKIQQAKELKEVLLEYKKALEEENKDKPKEDKVKMGRIRDIVAQMLNTSTTQVGRMEAIDNNLLQEFKEELEKGNINISTAHELSRLDEEKQAQAYAQYEEKGELHIKDVKEEPKPEITDEQTEWVQMAILDAVKGNANRDVFKANGKQDLIEKALRKHFEKTFQGKKLTLEDGKHFTYRFQAEGITLIDMNWKNFLIEYADLAEIVALMIEWELLKYDDTSEEQQGPAEAQRSTFMNEPEEIEEGSSTEIEEQKEEDEEITRQQNISHYPEYVPEPNEKDLDFSKWLSAKYGTGQYMMLLRTMRKVVSLRPDLERKIICEISTWITEKTTEYQKYLQG